jgi:hypothetical protein
LAWLRRTDYCKNFTDAIVDEIRLIDAHDMSCVRQNLAAVDVALDALGRGRGVPTKAVFPANRGHSPVSRGDTS